MINQITKIVNDNELILYKKHKSLAENIQKTLASFYEKPTYHGGVEYTSTGINILNCGTHLSFRRFFDDDETTKLNSANFCKHRLCPFCEWRLHLRNSAILERTFKILGEKDYQHLVLTIPNLKFINKQFILDLRENATKFIKKYLGIKDYFISFEVTISENGEYHPHYHIVFIKEKNLPTKKEIQKNWAIYAKCGRNYAICDIKKCTDNKVSLELTKYILKFENGKVSNEALFVLNSALHGIRKFSTAGIIKQAFEKAKDEIHIEKFEEMNKLKKFDSEVYFYEWLNGDYECQHIEKLKAITDENTPLNCADFEDFTIEDCSG